MKNSGLILGVVVILIAVVVIGGLTAYILANNTSSNSNVNNNQPSTNTNPNTGDNNLPVNNTNTERTSSPKTYDIEIKNFAFSPSSLTIKKGDSVTWTNMDGMPHTATADNRAFDSRTLNNGKSFTFTFNDAGDYSYICSIHPSMKAKIIVE